VADTHVIEAILKDFEQKLSGLDLHLTFQNAGQQRSILAVGRIMGSVSGKEIEVTLNVHPNGEIHTIASGPKYPNIQIEFVRPLSRCCPLIRHNTKHSYSILLSALLEDEC
jgi:hypothetical protein